MNAEWWGPDLTAPVPGDTELFPWRRERRMINHIVFDRYLNDTHIPFETSDGALVHAKIIEREVVKNFMDDSQTDYYIIVEWNLDP